MLAIWNNTKVRELLLFILMVSVTFIPRFRDYDSHAAIDEPYWVRRSANFYYQFWQGEYEELVYEYHPGITTLWVGTAGMITEFRGHRILGDVFEKDSKFYAYLKYHGETPEGLFSAMRFFNVFVNSILLLCFFYLTRHLLSIYWAGFIYILLSFDPMHFGHSRILSHESMMSLLLILSAISFMIYLYKSPKTVYLIFSGIFAGGALLTKSTATFLLLYVGLLLLIELIVEIRKKRKDTVPFLLLFWHKVRAYFIWLGALIVTYFALWPGMWVDPIKMLSFVYGTATNYVTTGNRFGNQGAPISYLDTYLSRMREFVEVLVLHTSPLVWLGLVIVLVYVVVGGIQKNFSLHVRVAINFILLAFFFYVMMSIAIGRRAHHYLMSVFVSLDIVAAIGVAATIKLLSEKVKDMTLDKYVMWGGFSIILMTQMWIWLPGHPYYYNYCNPLIELKGFASCEQIVGYGMGLDQAAAYLAEMPGSEDMKVMSWAGIGPFSYFFPGEVVHLSPGIPWDQKRVDGLRESEFLVIYPLIQLAKNEPKELLAALQGVEPDHVIWIDGIEYIWIYKVSELPDAVFIPGPSD